MHNFIVERTDQGNVYHHLGVLDGDLLKDLFASALPVILDAKYVQKISEWFLDKLRAEGYIVVQGNDTTVIKEMVKEVHWYGLLQKDPETAKTEADKL